MTTESVSTSPQPDHFADVAAALYDLAERFTDLIGSDLPQASVSLQVQPGRYDSDEIIVRSVDALTSALLGHGGQVQKMSNGTYHYNNGDDGEPVGPVRVRVLSSISTEFALKAKHASELAAKEAELAKLTAEVEAYRAAAKTDASGLGYSREDDPTPVSPARVPLHTGGVVDGGQLVDETDAPASSLLPKPIAKHYDTSVGLDVDCACGEAFNEASFAEAKAKLARHIETANAEPKAKRDEQYVGPYGVANWRAPLTGFERRAGVVEPAYVPKFGEPGYPGCPGCGKTVAQHAPGCAEDAE